MKMLAVLFVLMVAVLFLLLLYVCFRLVCIRGKHTTYDLFNLPENHNLVPYSEELQKAVKNLRSLKKEELIIESFDGLKLYGSYYECEGSRKTIVLMHGYRSIAENDFCLSIPSYLSMGFNVLTPHQRCHGKSEGRYITFGVREKYDCRDWIKKALEIGGENMDIVISGLSMGASTVLMASSLELPRNVKAIIADSGFTSGFDIVKNTARGISRIVPNFLIELINFYCRIFADFDLKEANTLNAMQQIKIPTLFVHGTRDSFVPCEMTLRNYATCRSAKELLTVAGAEHGISYLVDREKYSEILRGFISKYVK